MVPQKICTLVARIENGTNLRILGVGIEPSKESAEEPVVDINSASRSPLRGPSRKLNAPRVTKSTAPW